MPNRLAKETSPYLQQHADNPVDWYPWGEEALSEAKRTGRPILLSVGYSACHWCHVMAHESFEDPAIARVMNDLYINIKVDREERPDIDQIYQVAQAMLTQRNGGWPLTMFLTPDQLPFFGGTYFPNAPRYGMPGFGDLLKRVRQVYDEQRDALQAQGDHARAALRARLPRDRGVGDARDAVARRRLLLVARRRFRGRGRQVLRLGARRGAKAPLGRGIPGRLHRLRPRSAAQLREPPLA